MINSDTHDWKFYKANRVFRDWCGEWACVKCGYWTLIDPEHYEVVCSCNEWKMKRALG